jgi:hypothetical protein
MSLGIYTFMVHFNAKIAESSLASDGGIVESVQGWSLTNNYTFGRAEPISSGDGIFFGYSEKSA